MSQKNLSHYIEQRNAIKRLFQEKEYNLNEPLSEAEVKEIQSSLRNDLSPENLHCDGEISREKAYAKRDYLLAVGSELEEFSGIPCDLDY